MKPVVLQLLDSFSQGGSERQAVQLTRLLHDQGRYEVRLACLKNEGPLRREIEGLELGPIPSFPLTSFYDLNAVAQLRALVSFLRKEKIQILQTHDFYTNVFGMSAGALARVPVRIAAMRETAGMRTEAQKRVQRIAYSLAHHIVGNSEAVKRALAEDGVSDNKTTVVYNGLDLSRVVPQLNRFDTLKALGLSEQGQARPFVTIVANMRHDVKDYPMFLRAASHVVKEVPEVSFLMAGEGELTESLRVLSNDLGLDQNVVFLGRCDLVAELLSISDICVLSSKAEGFSNSILEYMAAARPVVATNVGGAAEAVVEGISGFLVPSGDVQQMADRLIRLLKEPAHARKMGLAGRQTVEERFSCEAQVRATEDLYRKLLDTSQGAITRNA